MNLDIVLIGVLSIALSQGLYFLYVKFSKFYYYFIIGVCFLLALYFAAKFQIPLVFGVAFGLVAFVLTSGTIVLKNVDNVKQIIRKMDKTYKK